MSTQPSTRKTGPAAPKADTQAEKTKKLAESRSAAVSALVEENRTRFNELMAAEARKRSVEWKPKPTAEEKALAEARALLEANPGLIQKLGLVADEGQPEATA